MKCFHVIYCVLCAGLGLFTTAAAQTEYEGDCAKLAASKGKDAVRLRQLLKLDWEQTMRDNPE